MDHSERDSEDFTDTQLRITALDIASSRVTESPEEVVNRAEAYFRFLQGE